MPASTAPTLVAEHSGRGGLSEVHIAVIIAVLVILIIIVAVAVIIVCLRRRRRSQKKQGAPGYHNDCIRSYDARGVYGYDKSQGLYRQEGSGLTSCCSNLNTSSTYSDLPDTGSLRHRPDYPNSLSDTYAVPDLMQGITSPDDPNLALLPRIGDILPPPPYPPSVGTISGNLVHHQSPHIPMYAFSSSPAHPLAARPPIPPPPPMTISTFNGPYATADLGRSCHQSRASTPASLGGRDRPHSMASLSGIQGVTGSSVYAMAPLEPTCSNLGLPEIPYSQLVFRQKIGSGHFGEAS